jgi:hypothetical protein
LENKLKNSVDRIEISGRIVGLSRTDGSAKKVVLKLDALK